MQDNVLSYKWELVTLWSRNLADNTLSRWLELASRDRLTFCLSCCAPVRGAQHHPYQRRTRTLDRPSWGLHHILWKCEVSKPKKSLKCYSVWDSTPIFRNREMEFLGKMRYCISYLPLANSEYEDQYLCTYSHTEAEREMEGGREGGRKGGGESKW
jgi:hypothetical protein